MKLDDLKTEWRAEMQAANTSDPLGFAGIKDDVAEVRRVVRIRDLLIFSVLALGALGTICARWLSGEPVGLLSEVGVATFAIGSAIASLALVKARRITRTDDWTLRSRLETEIERLERQRKLGSGVVSWLLAPMAPALLLLSLGGYHDRTGSYVPNASLWAYYIVCIAVFALTYWVCHREAARSVDPLLSRLRGLHHELVSN